MPIIISDYNWHETDDTVFLSLPIKGAKKDNISVLSTDVYLKVSYMPYLFECQFHKPLAEEESKGIIENGFINFNLRKQEKQIWGQLKSNDSDDKLAMRQHRDNALKQIEQRINSLAKEKEEKKRENEKYSLNEMMKIESHESERIKNEKDEQRQKMAEELEKWRINAEIQDKLMKEEAKKAYRNYLLSEKQNDSRTIEIEKNVDVKQTVRSGGQISVTFTPRVFPTPERESTKALEEEWLQTQMLRKKAAQVDDAELKENEKDPIWIRDRGNQYFAVGNYQAAVNAYSHAIDLKFEMHSLYSNRAACHLKLGNYFKALEDSSKAIELLNPPVPQNQKSRVRAHLRRAYSLVYLRMFRKGLVELKAAAQLDPDNSSIEGDIQRIEEGIESGQFDEENWSEL